MVKTRKGISTQPQRTPQLCSAAHNAGQPQESLYVTTTPMQRMTCEAARHPSTLRIAAALARIPKQPNSSCACEAAYDWMVLVAYAEYRRALENGDDTTEQWAWLEYCMSVFLFHYSRRFSGARIALPYFAAMEATTGERVCLGKRGHCDIVAMQQEAGFSFHAVAYANDRLIGRHDAEVLLYSPGARQFGTFLMLWYDIHNGGGGGVRAGPRAGRLLRAIIGAAAQQAPNQRHAPVVRHLVAQHRYVLFAGGGGACEEMCPTVASPSPNAIEAPRELLRRMCDATAAAVAAKDAIDAPLTIELPTDAPHVVAGGVCAMELEDAKAVWGAPAARLCGVESVSSRHHTNGTMKITVATLSGESFMFNVAAPGASDVLGRGDRVVVADPSVTGVATTASRAALVLDTPAHAFAGPYASSAGLRVLPTPQLDDRVVRFFGSDDPVGDTLSGLGRGAGASLSAVPRGRGALLGRLMALLEGGSCDRGVVRFETFSPVAAVLAPSVPTVSDDFTAVARKWREIAQRDHKKKKEREAFQMKPFDDDEEAPGFVGRVLDATSKKNSFYATLARALGRGLGDAALLREGKNIVSEVLHGVSAANFLIIGSLPESSEASSGCGALVGGLSVTSDAVDAPPEAGFTEQDRLDLQRIKLDGKLSKPRLEAAFTRHGLPPWGHFDTRKACSDLKAHLEKLLADAADSESEDDDSEDEADPTRGSGTEASLEEFGRVLGKFVRFKGAGNIAIGEDFLSKKLLSYIPTEALDLEEDVVDTSTQCYKASDLTSASDVLAERFDEVVALLDVASLQALACVSHAGAAINPVRSMASIWARRASTTDDEATPATFQSFLLDQFLPFGAADAPREERVEKAHELVVKMLLRAGEITVKKDVGVGHTPWEIIRDAGNHSRFSFVEFNQLRKAVSERNVFFQDYKASHIGCTTDTHIGVAVTKKLLDQYIRRLLLDPAREQELAVVVSRPSANGAAAGVTLAVSLSTFLVLSKKRREYFMDLSKKSKSGSYGNARTHSSPEAIKIIRDATEKIEATLEELSTDFPARRDAAAKYLLSLPDFQPKTASEREQVAAVHTWLNAPQHVREVERVATGEKKKKRKKPAESGRAKTKSRSKHARKKK